MTPEFSSYQEALNYVQKTLTLDLWSYARSVVIDLEPALADPPGGLYVVNSAVPCFPKTKPLYWAAHGDIPVPTLITDWHEIFTNPRADVLDINQDVVLRVKYLDMFKDFITATPTRLVTACLLVQDTAVDYLRRTTVRPGEQFQPTDISKYFKPGVVSSLWSDLEDPPETSAFSDYIPELVDRIWDFVRDNSSATYHVRKRTKLGLLEIEMGVDYRILDYYRRLEENKDE